MDLVIGSASKIKQAALKHCDACGITQSTVLDAALFSGSFPPGLSYINTSAQKRSDIKLWHKNSKSVLMCVFYYGDKAKTITAKQWQRLKKLRKARYVNNLYEKLNLKEDDLLTPASYAMLLDYHITIKEQLEIILLKIKENVPEAQGKTFVDFSPVAEKDYAIKCGLGSRGKNSVIYHPKFGSYILLGGISLNITLDTYDIASAPLLPNCQNCALCVNACPAKAIENYKINPNKCLSYYGTQHKGDIPEEYAPLLKQYPDGCDICMKICPLNKDMPKVQNPLFSGLL